MTTLSDRELAVLLGVDSRPIEDESIAILPPDFVENPVAKKE